MDHLGLAVIHDVKNRLAELALLLERRGDCGRETGIVLGAARQLTGLLLAERAASGQLAAQVESACPAELLRELAEEYTVLFPAITIQVEVAQSPAFWFYDEALVRLALANAIHNACRYASGHVTLTAREEQGYLIFEIADDGAGYPDSALSSADSPQAASHTGTGLGLYLARRIAALHVLKEREGKVTLSNSSGARFQLLLP